MVWGALTHITNRHKVWDCSPHKYELHQEVFYEELKSHAQLGSHTRPGNNQFYRACGNFALVMISC